MSTIPAPVITEKSLAPLLSFTLKLELEHGPSEYPDFPIIEGLLDTAW